MSDFTIEKAEAALKQRKTSIPKTAVCPCCANIFDSHDQPDEYARVTKWSAARELGKLNRGHKKRLTVAQRQEKARVLARNRKKKPCQHQFMPMGEGYRVCLKCNHSEDDV